MKALEASTCPPHVAKAEPSARSRGKKNKIRATTPRNPGEMEFIKRAGCDGDVIPALSEEGSVLEELLLRCFKEGEWVSLRGQVQGERERESTRNIA